ncbi:MAG: hypothetical protein QE485_00220 [Acidovorax sp.]|uniref:hypothetical protein n=1 Tax=Acidovorax sp. TaxID=1872122 RepID=UPI00260C0863|nr:hypothetical protein [Acidovorax sp.]MDH4415629.1 hypothetical protein [Acidovorax sp.]
MKYRVYSFWKHPKEHAPCTAWTQASRWRPRREAGSFISVPVGGGRKGGMAWLRGFRDVERTEKNSGTRIICHKTDTQAYS